MALVAHLDFRELHYGSRIKFVLVEDITRTGLTRVEATYQTNLDEGETLDPKRQPLQAKSPRKGNARLDGFVTERDARHLVVEGTWQ